MLEQLEGSVAADARRVRQAQPHRQALEVLAGGVWGIRDLHGHGIYSAVLAISPTTTGSVTCMIKPYDTCLNTRKINKLPTRSSGNLTIGLRRLSAPFDAPGSG